MIFIWSQALQSTYIVWRASDYPGPPGLCVKSRFHREIPSPSCWPSHGPLGLIVLHCALLLDFPLPAPFQTLPSFFGFSYPSGSLPWRRKVDVCWTLLYRILTVLSTYRFNDSDITLKNLIGSVWILQGVDQISVAQSKIWWNIGVTIKTGRLKQSLIDAWIIEIPSKNGDYHRQRNRFYAL